jgi:hypothetical protein
LERLSVDERKRTVVHVGARDRRLGVLRRSASNARRNFKVT